MDTIVLNQQRVDSWYFTSKDGVILKHSNSHTSVRDVLLGLLNWHDLQSTGKKEIPPPETIIATLIYRNGKAEVCIDLTIY